jgi:hypothetical protein
MSDKNALAEIQGKKIFFLYPTPSMQNQVISELAQEEYEVYITKDHTSLMRLLNKYPDSILYVNIDDKMSEFEWEKWIRVLITRLPEMNIGILSIKYEGEIKDKYLDIIKVSCGFTPLKVDMNRTVPRFMDFLNKVNAKGRRKYIRATIERETNAVINLPHNGDYINGSIKDISVVGISCTFEQDPILMKNLLIKDGQIRLQSMRLKVEVIVFGSRMDGYEKIYVFLFTQKVDPEVKTKIRKYIQNNLQSKMDSELKQPSHT